MPLLEATWAAPMSTFFRLLTLSVAAIDAILPTTHLLGLAPPLHTASSVAALTDAELSAAWLEPPLPYLEDGPKEGK